MIDTIISRSDATVLITYDNVSKSIHLVTDNEQGFMCKKDAGCLVIYSPDEEVDAHHSRTRVINYYYAMPIVVASFFLFGPMYSAFTAFVAVIVSAIEFSRIDSSFHKGAKTYTFLDAECKISGIRLEGKGDIRLLSQITSYSLLSILLMGEGSLHFPKILDDESHQKIRIQSTGDGNIVGYDNHVKEMELVCTGTGEVSGFNVYKSLIVEATEKSRKILLHVDVDCKFKTPNLENIKIYS